jgi:hypothetical protein
MQTKYFVLEECRCAAHAGNTVVMARSHGRVFASHAHNQTSRKKTATLYSCIRTHFAHGTFLITLKYADKYATNETGGYSWGKCVMKTENYNFFIIKRLFDYSYEMCDSLLLRWKSSPKLQSSVQQNWIQKAYCINAEQKSSALLSLKCAAKCVHKPIAYSFVSDLRLSLVLASICCRYKFIAATFNQRQLGLYHTA